jgi:hypothetical protein
MLSDKAKGKQRAVDLPDDSTPFGDAALGEPELESSRDLVIRFTEGIPDIVIPVSQHDAVRDVKRNVRVHSPFLQIE